MRHNIWLKLACVMLALAMWLFVVTKEQASVTLETQVEFSGLPSGLAVVDPGEPHVTAITVKGPERLLKNLDKAGIRVFVDMKKARAGKHRYEIDKSAVRLPALVRLASVSPSSLVVVMEEAGAPPKRGTR